MTENSARVQVRQLRRALRSIEPIHDTPLGVIHPYWARKPLNLVELIIRELTVEGDKVVDPFMGSGTTIFGALRLGRKVVGNDISPLSHFLVSGLLELIQNHEVLVPEIERILHKHRELTLPWYSLGAGKFAERIRYNVTGDFAHGNFELEAVEIVSKENLEGRWRKRTPHVDKETLSRVENIPNPESTIIKSPIDFESVILEANSRIAIPEGARLSHFFTQKNRASINTFIELTERSSLYQDFGESLKFILSASLPQLRLSDKKASSQWPYWRPKTDLTSRNPVMVLQDRFEKILSLVEWIKGQKELEVLGEHRLLNFPAQELKPEHIGGRAQLVLTDPPYGDQVPYLEYSAMWNAVLGLEPPLHSADKELVISNSSKRNSTAANYIPQVKESFRANADLVIPGGFLVWFYQDQNLKCWEAIAEAAQESGMILLDVIPLPKQRRSLKTVVSPNTTLDGDLACVFAKDQSEGGNPSIASTPIAKSCTEDELSYFDRYALLIGEALVSGNISALADRFGTVKKALRAREEL